MTKIILYFKNTCFVVNYSGEERVDDPELMQTLGEKPT